MLWMQLVIYHQSYRYSAHLLFQYRKVIQSQITKNLSSWEPQPGLLRTSTFSPPWIFEPLFVHGLKLSDKSRSLRRKKGIWKSRTARSSMSCVGLAPTGCQYLDHHNDQEKTQPRRTLSLVTHANVKSLNE